MSHDAKLAPYGSLLLLRKYGEETKYSAPKYGSSQMMNTVISSLDKKLGEKDTPSPNVIDSQG